MAVAGVVGGMAGVAAIVGRQTMLMRGVALHQMTLWDTVK